MIMIFERLLSWHYGDKQRLKQVVEKELVNYKALKFQTAFVQRRIADYEAIVEKCNAEN